MVRAFSHFRYRYTGGERGRGRQLLLSILLGLTLAVFLIQRFDALLRPQLVALAETGILNRLALISNQAVTQTMTDQAFSYTDLVQFRSGQEGEPFTLSTDTVRLNNLRTNVLEYIVAQVEHLDSDSLGIPFGTLTGLDLFSAFGPNLPVRVLGVASAEGNYRNEFSAAGINQTVHRILLDVNLTVRLLLPGGIETVALSVPVCVAETVIVGQVPQTYLNLNQ